MLFTSSSLLSFWCSIFNVYNCQIPVFVLTCLRWTYVGCLAYIDLRWFELEIFACKNVFMSSTILSRERLSRYGNPSSCLRRICCDLSHSVWPQLNDIISTAGKVVKQQCTTFNVYNLWMLLRCWLQNCTIVMQHSSAPEPWCLLPVFILFLWMLKKFLPLKRRQRYL